MKNNYLIISDLLKQGLYQGFNITIPYKETIIKYLDKLSFQAEKLKPSIQFI